MYHNFVYPDVNVALPHLLDHLIAAPEVGSRAGRTKELTHVGITLTNPCRREVTVPGRKPNLAAQIAETVWVLAGHGNIGWLGHYLPRAKEFSDDGRTWRAAYGTRLRSWPRRDEDNIDQLAWVVDLLQAQPGSRQAVMSIWDPVIDTTPGKDIPCNDWLSFSSRLGKLDLHVAVRSNDIIWGWSGINQFEWSVLLEVVAGLLQLEVGALHFSTTSLHVYDRHWFKAHKIAETAVPLSIPDSSPRFDASKLGVRNTEGLDDLISLWFEIEKGIRHGEDVNYQISTFPEPMFQSWLRVLQWWWSGDTSYLESFRDTDLGLAARYSVQPPEREKHEKAAVYDTFENGPAPSDFIQFAIDTHNEKHAAYGDSWKRRGEMLGIMANIARKVDRLGGSATADETSADTAMDLFVYLAKYRSWLAENGVGPRPINACPEPWSDYPLHANVIMGWVERNTEGEIKDREATEDYLRHDFDRLESMVDDRDPSRWEIVENMLHEAYRLARFLFEESE